MSSTSFQHICFSDIDGTLVHYLDDPAQLQEIVGDILLLPQSSTGRLGIISQASLAKAAQLRSTGTALVIISGARTSTVLQRLPYLPAADAIVAENGGRIWYPDPSGLTMCPLKEDLQWRQQLADVTGPADQDTLPPLQRKGALWDWYRLLHSDGWNLDANSYSTAFRLIKTPHKTEQQLQAAAAAVPPCLATSTNLGSADFYPRSSGKEGAAAYLMGKFRLPASRCAVLCDDDNDLQLAELVGKAFLPSIAAPSVTAAVAAHPERFVVADVKWTGGTEQMLDAVRQHFQQMDQQEQHIDYVEAEPAHCN
eukprot:GHRQ01005904.1.p1 GENE.GHRQ01005904.1~~GHRQ01005904.1.p1  ORF type:complete len:310 (+),score=119.36 GHRQ01005904.1:314-1243(+)